MVGPRAGETLGELALAVSRKTTVLQLASISHAYPTYNDGPWNAVIDDVRSRIAGPRAQRAIGVSSDSADAGWTGDPTILAAPVAPWSSRRVPA